MLAAHPHEHPLSPGIPPFSWPVPSPEPLDTVHSLSGGGPPRENDMVYGAKEARPGVVGLPGSAPVEESMTCLQGGSIGLDNPPRRGEFAWGGVVNPIPETNAGAGGLPGEGFLKLVADVRPGVGAAPSRHPDAPNAQTAPARLRQGSAAQENISASFLVNYFAIAPPSGRPSRTGSIFSHLSVPPAPGSTHAPMPPLQPPLYHNRVTACAGGTSVRADACQRGSFVRVSVKKLRAAAAPSSLRLHTLT